VIAAFLTVGDGARQMKTEYWPDTVPLTTEETACCAHFLNWALDVER
jgi:hypothetical protein